MTSPAFSRLTHLECSLCGATHDAFALLNLCPSRTANGAACAGPLLARYADGPLERDHGALRDRSIWRWHELMPARTAEEIVTLGEGGTPLLPLERLGARFGMKRLLLKEEGGNPTGSFKARGLSAAVTCAKARGALKLAVPTAGNAGGATAAYAARAGLEAYVFMPADTPRIFRLECEAYGARVTLVDGLIDACGRIIGERKDAEGWFDVSTLKEPYRAEGKKTMGFELAEQLSWELPDVVVYPTGGGTGLIGMWKAFEEMERLGWIGSRRPRLVSVQAEGCAPVVRAFAAGARTIEKWEGATTYASGLRVPKPYADRLVMTSILESGGAAVAVSDDEMRRGVASLAETTGVFAAPEGGASVAALGKLLADGRVGRDERVVLFDTGTGFKYVD